MPCERCGAAVPEAELVLHCGQKLCEDCLMDALSPTRTCDPWAVHSAKNCERHQPAPLTILQERLLAVIERENGLTRPALLAELRIGEKELEREVAALRHMEKLRGEKRGDLVFIVPWGPADRWNRDIRNGSTNVGDSLGFRGTPPGIICVTNTRGYKISVRRAISPSTSAPEGDRYANHPDDVSG